MKKAIIFGVVLALFSTILVSCSKDDDDQTTDIKQVLIDKTWQLTSVETEKEDATFTYSVNLLLALYTLQYDFKEDSTYTATSYSSGISLGEEEGTWSISSDLTTLTIDNASATISSCTETTLKLSGDEILDFGIDGDYDTGTITMVFTAQ